MLGVVKLKNLSIFFPGAGKSITVGREKRGKERERRDSEGRSVCNVHVYNPGVTVAYLLEKHLKCYDGKLKAYQQ